MKRFIIKNFWIALFFLAMPALAQKKNKDKQKERAPKEVVNKMMDEMCSAMSLYKKDDIDAMQKCVDALLEISKKEDEYGKVTEEQLKSAMRKNVLKDKKLKELMKAGE